VSIPEIPQIDLRVGSARAASFASATRDAVGALQQMVSASQTGLGELPTMVVSNMARPEIRVGF
jgi:hypothetical protein